MSMFCLAVGMCVKSSIHSWQLVKIDIASRFHISRGEGQLVTFREDTGPLFLHVIPRKEAVFPSSIDLFSDASWNIKIRGTFKAKRIYHIGRPARLVVIEIIIPGGVKQRILQHPAAESRQIVAV